ncbi:unnamed protein product [Linum tenue]|uniref:Secreted protein n=1 Tax=Linum tenue TaxID=586396 RepID=A0AAV0S677_9ROSI|nr:unnamed protein product [Linum tenue]
MVMRPKKRTVWTNIAIALVCMFPNSTTLPLPGSWNSSPGLSSTNSTTAITTGPQSAIAFFLCLEGNNWEVERQRVREVSGYL